MVYRYAINEFVWVLLPLAGGLEAVILFLRLPDITFFAYFLFYIAYIHLVNNA
jgi:hypothetical protein